MTPIVRQIALKIFRSALYTLPTPLFVAFIAREEHIIHLARAKSVDGGFVS